MTQKKKFTVDEIVKFLMNEAENETIEGSLIRPGLIRELYKQLGVPQEEDFPQEYEIAGGCWEKQRGYTLDIDMLTESEMLNKNETYTTWRIRRSSGTKVLIADRYAKAGWHCEVQAFNVICTKYVKHPKYKNIWVRFYSSRDCNKYTYIIERR